VLRQPFNAAVASSPGCCLPIEGDCVFAVSRDFSPLKDQFLAAQQRLQNLFNFFLREA